MNKNVLIGLLAAAAIAAFAVTNLNKAKDGATEQPVGDALAAEQPAGAPHAAGDTAVAPAAGEPAAITTTESPDAASAQDAPVDNSTKAEDIINLNKPDQPGKDPAASLPKQVYPSLRDDDYILGDAKAPVTMFEYASMSCSHCAEFHKSILPVLDEKYIKTGKLRIVFRHFPLNEPALRAAQLTHCVPKDKFFTFVKVLFGQQEKWAFEINFKEQLASIANVGGFPQAEFNACMDNKAIEDKLLEERMYGTKSLIIESTPTFFINQTKIEGARPIEEFEKAIEAATKP